MPLKSGKEEQQQKIRHLKNWRKESPAKKSQGRFPQWIKDSVVELAPDIGVMKLSRELDIGQRTIVRWIKEANNEEAAAAVQNNPLETAIGEDLAGKLPNDAISVDILIKHGGTEIKAEVDKKTLEEILSILFK